MNAYAGKLIALLTIAGGVAGCSNSGPSIATGTLPLEKSPVASTPRVDPQCVSLASQIDGLRAEGSVDRLEKASAGKGSNVQVKRASLAKQAELNRVNSEFQLKCGPPIPRAQAASIAAPAAASAPAAALPKPAAAPAAAPAASN